jgi:hypothetical protein
MAIFDSNKVRYLTYYIVLTDPDAVKALQVANPNGLNQAIGDATGGAVLAYSAPFRGYTDPMTGAPYIWTPNYSSAPTDKPYPIDVARFTRHTGGFLGIGGTTVTYYWIGQFVLATAPSTEVGGVVVSTPGRIPKRYWLEGFENYGGISSASLGGGNTVSRDASRHVGGFGYAMRGSTSGLASVAYNVIDAAANVPSFWERVYIRLRKKPTTGSVEFWRCSGTPSSGNGAGLAITTAGQILVTQYNNPTATVLGTLTGVTLEEWTGLPEHHAWVRLDILGNYNSAGAGGTGRLRVYVRGASTFDASFAAGVSLGGNSSRIASSQLGNVTAVANDLELDLDDWHGADIPRDGVGENLTGDDFLNGSTIRKISPSAFNAASSGWVGDFRTLLQQTLGAAAALTSPTVTSTTSGAVLVLDTDSAIRIDDLPERLDTSTKGGGAPITALQVEKSGTRGTTSGTLGYKMGTQAAVDTAIVEQTFKFLNFVLYRLDGTTTTFPASSTPIQLRHIKGADVSVATQYQISAQAEIVGMFGPEDVRLSEVTGAAAANVPSFPRYMGQHNAPYPKCQWAIGADLAQAAAPYIVKTGTYVGNGTGQDLTFRAPVCMFFARPTTGSTGGVFWMSPALDPAQGMSLGLTGGVTADEDRTFVPGSGQDTQMQRYYIRLGGATTQINALGVTYQYIAVMDPGARFVLASMFTGKAALASRVHALINDSFLPEFAIFHRGQPGNTSTVAFYGKSSANAVATVAGIGVGSIGSAVTFGTGQLTFQSAFIDAGYVLPFLLFRKHDGNNDTGEAAVFSIGGFTGDGSASRTLTVGTAGKRPIWALVFGENSSAGYRDPTFTGTASEGVQGAVQATSITAGGIDSITLGLNLNANGVVYSYLVFWGDTTAGNAGWGVNGEYIPVEADMPADDGSQPASSVYDTPVVVTSPDSPDDITTDLAATCIDHTTLICNRALSALGISKRITALATDTTQHADECRLHYGICVTQVLQAHVWAFATRYEDLVLVGGTESTPVNKDWQYSYRAPALMVEPRRIVGQYDQRRTWDLNPIKFILGSDDAGYLIYTNAAIATDQPVVLEFTTRLDCPARQGTPLFRAALTWKLAAAIAPALTRDVEKKVAYCEAKYRELLPDAETKDANAQQREPEGDADWISARL